MTGSAAFFEAVEGRRSYYGISPESPISKDAIVEIVQKAVKHVPSSFNVQSGRALVVFGEANKKLWEEVESTYLPLVGDDAAKIAETKGKLASFAGGYGTVAFFEDEAAVEALANGLPAFRSHFSVWSQDSTGMLQYIVWTALEAEGLGASLQHYGAYAPTTLPAILKAFDLPQTWRSTALLPFGKPTAPPGNPARPKTFAPLEDRVKVVG